jgi:DNA-binding response OmpR family regulator
MSEQREAGRVLLVEDDPENCRAIGELLAAEGFEIDPFLQAEAAWNALVSQAVQPDVVVADVRMPGLDGVALLRRIRARFDSLPVFLVSAFADEELLSQGLKAGALEVFPKPIHGASLVRAIRRAMGAANSAGDRGGETHDPS